MGRQSKLKAERKAQRARGETPTVDIKRMVSRQGGEKLKEAREKSRVSEASFAISMALACLLVEKQNDKPVYIKNGSSWWRITDKAMEECSQRLRDKYDLKSEAHLMDIPGDFITFNGQFVGHEMNNHDHNPSPSKNKKGRPLVNYKFLHESCDICRWDNPTEKARPIDDLLDVVKIIGAQRGASLGVVAEALIDLEG